ncbi:MAG: UspA domain protein [Marmoricola sp.]|nr:UspA domain protein [Marmoricola sp.]
MTTASITRGSIVVGYAGPQDDEHALAWAARKAALENRTLSLVHAVQPPTGYELGAMAGAYMVPDDVIDAVREGGRLALSQGRAAVAAAYPALEVETFLYDGAPERVLLEHAGLATCLVVGSRGRGRIASLLLGSVGIALARSAICPIVVVRPHHPGKVRNGVLVGTDCTRNTRSTLEFAYREASLRRLPLTVLHVVPAGDPVGPDHAEHRIALAETVAGMSEKFPDVRVRTSLAAGSPDAWLASQSDAMDLLVVGHHHQSGFADAVGIGSYVPRVIATADCPVAVVFEAPAP